MATMNISLPDELKAFAESEVAEGRFSNISDYMRHLIRKEQDRIATIAEIQAALDAGDASGYHPYSRKDIEDRLGLTARKKDAA